MHLTSRMLAITLLIGTVAVAAVACSSGDDEPNAVTISAADFSFNVTAGAITPGVNTVTFRNDGSVDHHMQIFRLSTGKTTDDLVQAMSDPTAAPPTWALPVGGVGGLSSGGEASATLDFREGSYALLCFFDDPDGVPHFLKGMAQQIDVEGSEVTAAAPAEDVTIKGRDYTFEAPETLSAGEHTIRFTNEGQEGHEMNIVRLPDGVSVSDADLTTFFASEDAPPPFEPFDVTFVGGAQAIIPGASQLATVDLEPGNYVLLCFIPDAEGVPHAGLGMVRQIRVE